MQQYLAGFEPVTEPCAQTKVARQFLETKPGHLVLPEAAHIAVKLENALQTHLWKEAKSRRVCKAVFLLATLLLSVLL